MAGLTFEDTEKALKLYYSGLLGDDIPKPQHRDGRIVEFTPKGRRRLEGVTVEMVRSALLYIRTVSETDHLLIELRYKEGMGFELIPPAVMLPEMEAIERLGKALHKLSQQIILADDCEELVGY